MKKNILNSLKYIAFLAIGILIFWSLYRNFEWPELMAAMKGLKYHWIILSILLNMLAQFSRTLRWKMLIKPLGYVTVFT